MSLLKIKDEDLYTRKGLRRCWFVVNMDDLFMEWKQQREQYHGREPRTFDFTTMYTCLEHEFIFDNMEIAINEARQFWTTCNHQNVAVNNAGTLDNTEKLMTCIRHVVTNSYFCNGGDSVRHQEIGLPMGTNCAPELANLTLYVIESKFVDNLSRQDLIMAKQHAQSRRFIDDVICWDVPPPSSELYGLNWLETTEPNCVTYLGARIVTRPNGSFETSVFNKFDEWKFNVIKYPHVDSNVPVHQATGIVKGQLYRFRLICNSIKAFKIATTSLVSHMIHRGHSYYNIYKGWISHLTQFNSDKFTNYGKLKAWFKRMSYWVEVAHRRGTLLCSPLAVSVTPTQGPPVVVALVNHMDTPVANVTDVADGSLQLPVTGLLPDASTMANEFMNSIADLFPASQEAYQSCFPDTSDLYLLLSVYREFYADTEERKNATSILTTMRCRWNKTKKCVLDFKCDCGQVFVNEQGIIDHKNSAASNCDRTKSLLEVAIDDITSELAVVEDDIAHSSSASVLSIGGIFISPGCLASLSSVGHYIRNEIINASLHILSLAHCSTNFYFDLRFMHSLIDNTGYNYNAVRTWTGVHNIFTKKVLHFSVVYNKCYVHVVVHTAERLIVSYDILGGNQLVVANVIKRYLYDEFIELKNTEDVSTQQMLIDSFNEMDGEDDWTVKSGFNRHCPPFNDFDPFHGGVYLLKAVDLLHQPSQNFASFTEDDVEEYRVVLATKLQNFQFQ